MKEDKAKEIRRAAIEECVKELMDNLDEPFGTRLNAAKKLRALLDKEPAPVSQWQPIETAPHDVEVLLYWARSNHIKNGRCFHEDGDIGHVLFDGECLSDVPTHWMPRPATPEGVTK